MMHKNRLSNDGKHKIALMFIYTLTFLLYLYFLSYITIQPGDDVILGNLRQMNPFYEYLKSSYLQSNGRVFSNTLVYILSGYPLYYWKILAAACLTAFGPILACFTINNDPKKWYFDIFFIILCNFGIFLITSSILIPSVFWFTGSLHYFIPLVFGMIGIVPVFLSFTNRAWLSRKAMPVFFVLLAFGCFSSEQISIGLFLIALGIIIYFRVNKTKLPPIARNFLIVLVVFVSISIASPGNWSRVGEESSLWFAQYTDLGFGERFVLACGFVLTSITNQWYYLLILLFAISGILLFKRSKGWKNRVLAVLLFFFGALCALRMITFYDFSFIPRILVSTSRFFTFPYLLGTKEPITIITYFVYILWIVGLILLPISWISLYKEKKKGWVLCYLYIVALILLAFVGFSPTMFVSGGRTGLIPNVLLLLILLIMISENRETMLFSIPSLLLIAFKIFTLISRWSTNSFFVDYGLIDMPNLFFH